MERVPDKNCEMHQHHHNLVDQIHERVQVQAVVHLYLSSPEDQYQVSGSKKRNKTIVFISFANNKNSLFLEQLDIDII